MKNPLFRGVSQIIVLIYKKQRNNAVVKHKTDRNKLLIFVIALNFVV